MSARRERNQQGNTPQNTEVAGMNLSELKEKTITELNAIARELNVEGVIEGSVMRSGDRVRVIAQLIDARKDEHLWARDYERDLRDVLGLQAEVAQAIAQEVRAKLNPGEEARLARSRPVVPEAQEAYLKGRFYLGQGTEDSIEKANAKAVERYLAAQPRLTGVGVAREVLPGMKDRMLLHAGPPVEWQRASRHRPTEPWRAGCRWLSG